jgi:hypothetical protein
MTAPAEQPPSTGSASKDDALARRRGYSVVYLFLFAVALSAFGLYWINHEVHVTEAALQRQAEQQVRAQQRQALAVQAEQRAAAAKQSVGICVALVGLDNARIGAEFAPPSRTGVPLTKSYGYRLAKHLHDVVEATHCRALLAGKLPKGAG